MDSIIVFQQANSHPLSWLLHRDLRHVWCAVIQDDMWVSYDWRQGMPMMRAEAGADFDLAGHYRDQGYTVIETTRPDRPVFGPFVLNNCVGHTKLLMGIRSWALTPRQLYKHLMKRGHPA
tara:strand:+ start:985 stop:1344 length:360 start_codon:yes stop_codon:yes gene_type:complete